MISRRHFCASTLATAAAVTAAPPLWAADDKRAICYNCSKNWADWGTVLDRIAATTGIVIPPDSRTSGEALTSLIAEKDHPIADIVYFGGDYSLRAKEAGVITPYHSKYASDVPEALKDPEGYWTALHTGTIGFFINKEVFGKRAIPRSWADLLKPEYDGVVGYYDIPLSAAGYVSAMAVNVGLGGTLENWKPALDYFVALQKNHPIIPRIAAYARVLSGEIPLLVDFDFNAYRGKYTDKGDVEVVIPSEGTVSFPYVMTLIKGAPHPESGKQMIDFVLSDEGQQMWANAYLRPARPIKMDAAVAARFLPDADYAKAKTVNIAEAYGARKKFAEFIESYKSSVI